MDPIVSKNYVTRPQSTMSTDDTHSSRGPDFSPSCVTANTPSGNQSTASSTLRAAGKRRPPLAILA